MKTYNNEMFVLARLARGYSQIELAKILGIRQGTLSKIENNILEADEHIALIAQNLDFPVAFFKHRIKQFTGSAHYYRRKNKTPRKETLRLEAVLNIIKHNIERMLLSVNSPEVKLPRWDVEKYGSPTLYAKHLREYWRIPKGPITNLTKLIEDNGIVVMLVDFDTEVFDGLSFYTADNQPLIFLNKNMPGDRLRLTLAHEVGHLGMHFSQRVGLDRDAEKEAYEFGAELLVPSDEIMTSVSKINLSTLADLKRYWKISMAALLFHAVRINLITSNSGRYIRTQLQKNGYLIEEPAELAVPIEKPSLVKEMIDVHLNDLDYSNEEMLKLLCLNKSDFKNFYFNTANRLRIVQ